MGRGDGVEPRAASIRLFFVDQHGERHRETYKVDGITLKPSNANIAAAKRLAAKIRKEIELGLFNIAEHFPHSKHAPQQDAHTFAGLCANWLAGQSGKAEATRSQYRNAVAFWKRMFGANTPVEQLTHERLVKAIGDHPWKSAKLRNNYLIALRGPLALRYRGRRALDNPMIGIENARTIKKLPDPLTVAERDTILADMAKHYDTRVVAYFTLAFFTGMRPEELIALRWEDIDWRQAIARVQRVRTFKGSERDETKTGEHRDVDLVPAAVAALQAMKPFTFMKRDEDGELVDIFENPITGRAWHDERSQRDTFWKPSLRRLGIRARRAYCTRHTYCTSALMAGIKPAYIAAQSGHSVAMLLSTYARWIPGGDAGTERQKLAAALASPSTHEVPNNQNGTASP